MDLELWWIRKVGNETRIKCVGHFPDVASASGAAHRSGAGRYKVTNKYGDVLARLDIPETTGQPQAVPAA